MTGTLAAFAVFTFALLALTVWALHHTRKHIDRRDHGGPP